MRVILFAYADAYDAMVLSGAMGEGHIPCRGLTEMIRVVKPGKSRLTTAHIITLTHNFGHLS
jgi:hypothetical protein